MDGVGEWATTSAALGVETTIDIRSKGDPLSALARPALLRVHLLHRLQGQFRRIQGHGPRALRRADATLDLILRPSDRSQARRLVPPEPRLFQLLHRPDDDERASSTRSSAAPPRDPEARSTQRHMDLAGLDPGGDRGVVLRLTRSARDGDRRCRISASPAASRSTASPTARCCATGRFDDIWIQPAAGDAGGALGRGACRVSPVTSNSRGRHDDARTA